MDIEVQGDALAPLSDFDLISCHTGNVHHPSKYPVGAYG
jgi:hypothetical protein